MTATQIREQLKPEDVAKDAALDALSAKCRALADEAMNEPATESELRVIVQDAVRKWMATPEAPSQRPQ